MILKSRFLEVSTENQAEAQGLGKKKKDITVPWAFLGDGDAQRCPSSQ